MQTDDLTTEIEGTEFRVIKYDPEYAYDLMFYLGRLMGGSLGNALGAFAMGDDTADATIGQLLGNVDGDAFGAAIERLFMNLDEAKPSDVMRNILCKTSTKIEGDDGLIWDDIDLNRDFDGDLFAVFPLMAYVLRENYENFFQKLRKFAETQGAEMVSKAKSQISSNDQTSSGGSGGQSSKKSRRLKRS